MSEDKITHFYDNYHGHKVNHLAAIHDYIRKNKNSDSTVIFLAGDSSLDNKHWLESQAPAINGYENILDPPVAVKDICFLMNKEILARGTQNKYTVLNCSIEESTIGNRACFALMEQDQFIREHVQPNDVVILSVGGNDIALSPSLCTILNAACLVCCTTTNCIDKYSCGSFYSCDDYCCGCCCGFLSNFLAWPCGYGYLLHLFGSRVKSVATRLISGKHKPKKVIICMIYYLDQATSGSWADAALGALGYNKNPAKLQLIIRKLFEEATQSIKIEGTEVIAVPLFIAMDGTVTEDYVQRVEPSVQGGQKMSTLLLDAVEMGTEAVQLAVESYDAVKLQREMARK